MSLLTPPHTSHRKDKENRFAELPVAGPSTRSVVWAAENTIHSLGTPLKHVSISSKQRPSVSKSILKISPTNTLLQVLPAAPARETTPEPSDPLVDLHYLDHPVQQILSNGTDDEEALGKLIVGYNVLAARLRMCVTESTDADASWPLFQPLRKNTQPFVDAVVRDVKRALVDPLSRHSKAEDEDAPKLPIYALPSPASSPLKKKGGLSEEQVKYARDLSTTCHSVIKLLGVVLSLPAIYRVFEEKQLADILTAVLAIPLADDLPTPNARKTCAQAIGLLQVQRLPAEILQPAAPRIAYALRRGMDGELGKEGKKGSANDGLRAIHDLCVYLPAVFIPAFTPLLPSVLANLLAPTLALRTQACHALGGFVNGSVAIPVSTVHTKISNTVAVYITTASPSPGKPGAKSAAAKPAEAAIVRTLRTTLANAEPTHVASGPVWALSVLACFVVLIGPRLYAETKANRIISTLLGAGLRHAKSALRALTCAVWRQITWAYFQAPLPAEEGEACEVDGEEEGYMRAKQARLACCKVMLSVVECQAGAATIAALLADENPAVDGGEEEGLRIALDVLLGMTGKAGQTCQEGVEALHQMTSGAPLAEPFRLRQLVPPRLFSANPGLLTAEWRSLAGPVRAVYEQLPGVPEIRPLTREEMGRDWVFRGMMGAWRTSLGCLEMEDQAEIPENLCEIWENLLRVNVSLLEENGDEDGVAAFAACAMKYILHVLEDPKLNLLPNKSARPSIVAVAAAAALADPAPGSDDTIPEYGSAPNVCTNGELRMRLVRAMWGAVRRVFPGEALREAGETLLVGLMRAEDAVVRGTGTAAGPVDDEDAVERALRGWVGLCGEVGRACGEVEGVRVFWSCEEDGRVRCATGWGREGTGAVWRAVVERWREVGGGWEAGVVLLGVPFMDRHTWGLASDDYSLWEELLQYTTGKALDLGIDSAVVLDKISAFVSSYQTPGASPASGLRLIDLLLSHLDAADLRELPVNILEHASETMRAMYPLEPRYRQFGMWMVRSLTTVVEHCPRELGVGVLRAVEEGVCVWLADGRGCWTEHEMIYDIVPLYQHIILKIQVLPESLETLEATGAIMDSIFRYRTPAPAVESFMDFWNLIYARMAPPAEGWPASIRHCLGAVGILPFEQDVAVSAPVSPLAPAFVVQPSSPRTPISASFSTPPTAILKREALSRVQSPQRPQKVFGAFPIMPSTPPSPVNNRRGGSASSAVRRTPLSAIQLCDTPSKRRRLMGADDEGGGGDKENALGGAKIPSVADRIAGLSLVNPHKRRFDEVDEEVEKPTPKKLRGKMRPRSLKPVAKPVAKRPRLASPAPSAASVSSNESEDERRVEAELTAVEEQRSDVARRTRGNGLRAAVALQVAQEATPSERARTESLGSQSTERQVRKIDLSKMSLRRSTSIPEVLLNSVSSRKRKHGGNDEGEDSNNRAGPNHPSGVRFGPPRGAKRSFSLPSSDSDLGSAQPMSSDDDPHYGQVTPHNIISPALARRPGSFGGRFASSSRRYPSSQSFFKELFGEDVPGSDDSVGSSSTEGEEEAESPTKQFVTRQLQRTSSADALLKFASSSSSGLGA